MVKEESERKVVGGVVGRREKRRIDDR